MNQSWIEQARAHWKEFQPTRYRELKQANRLEAALKYAADQTHREMSQLENSGLTNQEAWEMVREQYLFPPEETATRQAASGAGEAQKMAALRGQREVSNG